MGSFSVFRRWVMEGPNDSDGTVGWLFGMWLWWRMWAVIVLGGIVPLAVGLWVFQNVAPLGGVFAAWFTTSILEPRVMKINPKYNVEENY